MKDLTDRWLDMFFFLYDILYIEGESGITRGETYDIIKYHFPQCAEAFDNHMERMNQEYMAHQAQEDEQCPFN